MTISEFAEQNQQLKNDLANSRRTADHEREERRAEIDALSKTVEEKIRENEALAAEIEMLKLGSDMESVHDVI